MYRKTNQKAAPLRNFVGDLMHSPHRTLLPEQSHNRER